MWLDLLSVLCLTAAASASRTVTAGSDTPALPTVDLGYQVHRAIEFNESTRIYNFTTIRYAAPPVGALRFAAPTPPKGRNPTVQDGSHGAICPQALPSWFDTGIAFAASFAAGTYQDFNVSAPVPGTGIHGGGYVLGSKDDQTVPEGLMAAASANGEDIILVQINHRLGAFGWLAGPSVAASGGVSNAALYDQRLAIEWVAKYIGRFGGDPKRITLLGVSAGGGGIMHQITAFGGKKGVSFQRAVPQSAGWVMKSDRDVQENTTRTFLQILGVNTIEEARQLPSDKVIAANTKHIREYSTWGLFTYGPVVDGVFVPEQPSQLLAKGAFAKDVKILPGHETYEGVIFVDPRVKSDEVIEGWLRGIFKTMSQDVMDYILKILYPPTFDGSFPYTTQLDRAIFLAGEAFFSCNTYYVNTAQRNTSYAYQFDVFPSLHGSDQPYTWYNGEGDIPSQRLFANVALVFQGYITNFAKTGTPNGKGLPKWPVYGKDGIELGINYPATSIKPNPDSAANERCVWWQKALFD